MTSGWLERVAAQCRVLVILSHSFPFSPSLHCKLVACSPVTECEFNPTCYAWRYLVLSTKVAPVSVHNKCVCCVGWAGWRVISVSICPLAINP